MTRKAQAAPDTFTVRYEVDDGYCGGARPRSFRFDAYDLDESMSDDQIGCALDAAAHDDMVQNCSANVTNRAEFVAWAREQIAKRKGDEYR